MSKLPSRTAVSFTLRQHMHSADSGTLKALPTRALRQIFLKRSAEISAVWNKMMPDEKDTATEHLMGEVSNLCETGAIGARNQPIAIFNDAHATLAAMEREVIFVHFILCS